ncbi:MAG: hypothetical protein LBR12_02840, partial [Opitutaceae bacterium]|nr:hypothetical protein [Opitutaceae bacterium]
LRRRQKPQRRFFTRGVQYNMRTLPGLLSSILLLLTGCVAPGGAPARQAARDNPPPPPGDAAHARHHDKAPDNGPPVKKSTPGTWSGDRHVGDNF